MSPAAVYYLLVQLGAVVAAFALGMSRLSEARLFVWPVCIGLCANFAIYLPEGGPELCMGIIAWPLACLCFTALGRGARRAMEGAGWIACRETWSADGPRCGKCGYLLKGLSGNVCPECGHPFLVEVAGSTRKEST